MHLNLFLPQPAPRGGRAGLARRVLRRLGPSWEATPARRVVQTLAFALFLFLFLYVMWPYGSKDYAALRQSKEFLDAESFLAVDPLVSLSTALAARAWVWSLAWAAALVAACLVFPRGFCGYLCPLGTFLDLVDWAVGRRVARLRPARVGAARHLRYYVLTAVLAAAALGVLLSGFVAAIPVLVRGMAFILGPLQIGGLKGWYLVPPVGAGQVASAVLFAVIVATALLGPRFWCRYVCPSGAVFSATSALRLAERKVDATCIRCGKCAAACSFDAIREDFSTRAADCTFCQTCGGVCPVRAIQFVGRWEAAAAPAGGAPDAPASGSEKHAPASGAVPVSRRGLLACAAGGMAAALGIQAVSAAGQPFPVRPPGSAPEREFLRLCIRCGACYQACPNNVLQPMGLEGGLDGLWTPQVVANWSGCEPTCNNCGHVCPTGAIRALPMDEKRVARMGLAVVNTETCLPHVGCEQACQMCYDECRAAGYNAIEFVRVGVSVDTDGNPIEGSGYPAPVVVPEKCVGCGLCQTRCYRINVLANRFLEDTAIRVVAGPGKEDRLMRGSYLALREGERRRRDAERRRREGQGGAADAYLPDFLK